MVRIIDLDTRIHPFGDRVGDLPCLDRTFASFRAYEIERSGVDASRLAMTDAAFVSAPLLATFARAAGAAGPGPRALALPASSPVAAYVGASSVRRDGDRLVFDVFWDAGDESDIETLRRAATPLLVEHSWTVRRREVLRVGPPPYYLDLVDDGVLAMHVEHWAHVLWLWPALVRRLGRGVKRNVIGKGVDIHPSAFVEGSVIADGVEIGASSSIRHSYVGSDAKLSDFTKVAYSVLGAETHSLADATFSEMVALGGGTLTNLLFKDSILGKNVFLTTGVTFWNDDIDKNVMVDVGGLLVDSGRRCLGGCAGHGSVLGARTILAPGRALPNRTTVVMRREEGVFSIAEQAKQGVPMCWDDGAMVPVRQVQAGYDPEELDE